MKERATLQTIMQLRLDTGSQLQYQDDGTPKSVQNSTMFADAYSRLSLKKCYRTCLAAQLDALGPSLGEQRPSVRATSEVTCKHCLLPGCFCFEERF